MATEYFNDAWRIPNNKNQSLVSNYSMEFNGISDKIGFGDVNGFDITDKFSGSCWIYSTAAGSDYILGKEQSTAPFTGYMLYIDPNRKLRFIMAVGFGAGNYFGVLANSSAIPYNTWTHLAFTYDGSTNRTGLKLYINSVLQAVSYTGNSTISGSMLNSNVPFQISGRGGSAANGINGKIDQTCMFDYALPATGTNSVATLYGGGTAVTNPMSLSPKPVAYYQLGDQSVDNGANYLVPNNSLQDYVFNFTTTGLTQRINIPSITIGSEFTASFWFNSSILINDVLLSGDSNLSPVTDHYYPFITTEPSGMKIVLSDASGTTSLQSSVPFVINTWFHIVITQSGGTATTYINGSLSTSGTARTFNLTQIASRTSTGFALEGQMSNVALFNTPLPATGTESIASLYNNGSPALDISSYNGLQRWYKLNAQDTFDGTNWTIKDYANNQDGTSVRMTSANLIQSNLQHTSGYSPYALDFSGITAHLRTYTIPAATNTVTLSVWVKRTSNAGQYAGVFGVRNSGGTPSFGLCWQIAFGNNDNKIRFRTSADVSSAWQEVVQNNVMPDNTWHHVAGVADGTNLKIYINGALQTDTKTQTNGILQTPANNIFFGMQSATSSPFNGQLSNCARWNVGLTQAQVTEIYNQGVPSNLNNFSGTAPIGWWQLGSNSSFEGNDWTCLDEIGTDYANSGDTAMTEDDIVNGVGYSANGLGTSSIEIIGDAPYSTANGISENMDVLDRTTDVPS